MSSSARSILAFGAYLVVVGAMLVVAPNVLLSLFGVPTTQEVWIDAGGALWTALTLRGGR